MLLLLILILELEEKLYSAEEKCQLLEKQLKYMKNIRHSSETDPLRFYSYEQQPAMHNPAMQPALIAKGYNMSPQIDKLAELERGQIKLTASQTLAEVTIRNSCTTLLSCILNRSIINDYIVMSVFA